MRIVYTAHAEDQVAERKIERIWVEEAIKQPDLTVREGTKYYVSRKLNGHTLKVVYVREKYIYVITCFFVT